jgi:hypothetical protein
VIDTPNDTEREKESRAPHIVIEFPNGKRALQRVLAGTMLAELEDLWFGAWLDTDPTADQRIRVGLRTGRSVEWLGYRDAKLPPSEPDDDDIDFGTPEEVQAFNDKNVAEAALEKASRTTRYPVIEWADGVRYTDWTSRTHDELIERAKHLMTDGAPYRLGWVDRDDDTGEGAYAWLDEQGSAA